MVSDSHGYCHGDSHKIDPFCIIHIYRKKSLHLRFELRVRFRGSKSGHVIDVHVSVTVTVTVTVTNILHHEKTLILCRFEPGHRRYIEPILYRVIGACDSHVYCHGDSHGDISFRELCRSGKIGSPGISAGRM